jgi:hypothetical protein
MAHHWTSSTRDSIVMRRKRHRRRPIAEIVRAIKPANYRKRRAELGIDPPVGKELW